MTELCAHSVLATGRSRRSSTLPPPITLLLLVTKLLLTTWLPVASTQPIASTPHYWTLTLNGQNSEALAELVVDEGATAAPGVLAFCTADKESPAYTFTWTLGEGTCLNASTQTGTVLLPPAGSPQQTGMNSTMQIPIAGLRAFRYYFVRCRAQSGRLSTSQCSQFRIYERTPTASGAGDVRAVVLDSLANGSAVSLQCDSLVLPSDVVVNVTWTRDGARLPFSAQQHVWSSSTSSATDNATYVVASRLVFDNSPAVGGRYTCTVDSAKYGRLLSQTTIAYRAAVAVFVDLNESVDYSTAGRSSTRVVVTCEGYGYPVPVLSLLRGQFVFYGNQTSVALEGGTRSLFVFHQPRPDGAAEISAYGCRAENDRAVDIAHYSEPQRETAEAAATSVGTPIAKASSVDTATPAVVVECRSSAVAGAQNGARERRPSAQPILSLLILMSASLLLT